MVKPMLGKKVDLYLKWTNDMEYRLMGNISSISTITFAPPLIDSTEYGDLLQKRFIYGLSDGPDISIKFWGNANDYKELYDYFNKYEISGIDVKFVLPDRYNITFKAYVVNFAFDLPKDAIFETTLVIKPVSDVKLHIEENYKYEIVLTTNGGGQCTVMNQYVSAGEEVVLYKSPFKDYEFYGWEVLEGGIIIEDDRFIMPSRNVRIQGDFVEKTTPKYHIEVESDGDGTCSANKEYAYAGEIITLSAKPRANYFKFDKWIPVNPTDLEIDEFNTFVMPAENVEIHGMFKVDQNVKWEANIISPTPNWGEFYITPKVGYYQQEMQVFCAPKSEYDIDYVHVKQGATILDKNLIFKMPPENVIIEVRFRKI